MAVQDRLGGGAVAAAVVCGLGLAAGLLATGCSSEGAAADDRAGGGHAGGGRAAGEPASKEAAGAVRESADTLVRSGSSRVRTTMETSSGGTRVAIRGEGAFNYRTRMGQLRLALPDAAEGRGGAHAPITEILAPGALYMKNRGAGVPADKWVRVDTATLADGNLVTGGATDPLSAAELLRGAREVTYRGERRLGGVTVRHYSGTADIGAAARAASAGTGPALAAAEKGFANDLVPFDAYLDEEGRLRKIRQRFSFVNGASGSPGATGRAGATEVTSTTDFLSYGTKAAVRLPQARDIYAGRIAATGGR